MSGSDPEEWGHPIDTGWGHPDDIKAVEDLPAAPRNRVTVTSAGKGYPIVITAHARTGRIQVSLSPRRALEVAEDLIHRVWAGGVR